MQQNKHMNCPACRLVRVFLLLAVPIMMMMWFQPELPLLKSINLTYAFANLVGFACVCVIAFKAYREFWSPARRAESSASKKIPTSIQAGTLEIDEPQSEIKNDAQAGMGSKAYSRAETETETETETENTLNENMRER